MLLAPRNSSATAGSPSSKNEACSGCETDGKRGIAVLQEETGGTLFVRSRSYEEASRTLPRNGKRAELVQSLIDATGVLSHCTVLEGRKLPPRKLQRFHTRDYVRAVESAKSLPQKQRSYFGLVDDCTVVDKLLDLVQFEAGGSVLAAQALLGGHCSTAIWWGGGRHHAGRNMASGYCYVNDVVLAVLELLSAFPRVMYIDIDVHHGDAVEEAFCFSESVLTVSFHKHGPLFFPGSGSMREQSGMDGRRCVINVPLQDGCSDQAFIPLCSETITDAAAAFNPSAIVLQCGADALSGDPVGCFSLSSDSYLAALRACQALSKPLLLLGGGGYHLANTARVWAAMTCVAAGVDVPVEVPLHVYYEEYAPDFLMHVPRGKRSDQNDESSLLEVRAVVRQSIDTMQGGHAEGESDDSGSMEASSTEARTREEESEGSHMGDVGGECITMSDHDGRDDDQGHEPVGSQGAGSGDSNREAANPWSVGSEGIGPTE